jgi:oxygen-dependent protoporphyrinogen oxidase
MTITSVTAPVGPSQAAVPFDAVVIGGGIAGLAAAWELRDTRICVLEADTRVGGRLMSERREPYWLNYGGHVLSGPDSSTGRLLQSVGVEARDVPGTLTALALGDQLLAGSRVETYPFRLRLSPAERLALVGVGARLRFEVERYRRAIVPRPAETEAARRQRILAFRGDQTFSEFLGPVPRRVDEIFRATIRRSSGEPEQVAAGYGIGYFQLVWDRAGGLTRNVLGGSSTLPEAIAQVLGDRIALGASVKRVSSDGHEVTVEYEKGGATHTLRARHAVLAIPSDVTCAIVTQLPPATARALASITYGPYVVGAFLTNEEGPTALDHVYAVGSTPSTTTRSHVCTQKTSHAWFRSCERRWSRSVSAAGRAACPTRVRVEPRSSRTSIDLLATCFWPAIIWAPGTSRPRSARASTRPTRSGRGCAT